MDMRRIAEELIGVAETLVGSERVGRRFMKFRKGRKYRVLKDGASLHWHVSDGPWSWKFKSVRLPAGAEIEYVGNVMGVGSDNIKTPWFKWKNNKGGFEPNFWGGVEEEWLEEVGRNASVRTGMYQPTGEFKSMVEWKNICRREARRVADEMENVLSDLETYITEESAGSTRRKLGRLAKAAEEAAKAFQSVEKMADDLSTTLSRKLRWSDR